MKQLAKMSGLIDDVMSLILKKLIEAEYMDKDWIVTSYNAKYEIMVFEQPCITDRFFMLTKPPCLDRYHYPKDKDITLMQLCEDYNFVDLLLQRRGVHYIN